MSDKARKLICALLAVILFTEPFYGGFMSAYATSTTDKIKQAEQEKKNAEQQLGQTQSTLNQLKDSKKAIQNSLNNLNEQLDETSDKMDDLQAQIDEKQANIEAVEKEYEDAVAQAAEQYKFIKVRIKKIYESGSDSIYDLLFNSSINHSASSLEHCSTRWTWLDISIKARTSIPERMEIMAM